MVSDAAAEQQIAPDLTDHPVWGQQRLLDGGMWARRWGWLDPVLWYDDEDGAHPREGLQFVLYFGTLIAGL